MRVHRKGVKLKEPVRHGGLYSLFNKGKGVWALRGDTS